MSDDILPVEERTYGWIPSPPDIRDHFYMAPRSLIAMMPNQVDLSVPAIPDPWGDPWDQSNIGCCGPHSSLADVVFSALRQQNLHSCPMPSRLFTYYVTREVMGTTAYDSGVDNRTMLKALAQFGWCDETLWPYITAKYRQQPPPEAYEQAKTRKIVEYLAVPQALDSMRACLAGGDPFIFGFSVYESMNSNAVNQTGDVPMPGRTERRVGGHDVLIIGFDNQTARFKFRNSWRMWGNKGYGTIPYEYALHPQLASDFWTVKHAALPDLPPDPPVSTKGKIVLNVDWTTKKVEVASVT